jgi:transcriptional regulator with GAF, ATPase, and Fis domain
VLIQGESGTGKELLARLIHQLSPRSEKPIITINCNALSENLLESELFGHEKGSFTGAAARRIGRFEEADGGTLFLDEIGEITASVQIKLLRFLQEREFQRVGGNQTIHADVRIISATNRDLEARVREGFFREDLFYRLNVVVMNIPPLRERKDDIPPLIEHFLKRFSIDNGKKIDAISREARDLLLKYDYPGNVRELENIIERSVALESTNIILPDNLFIDREQVKNDHPHPAGISEVGIQLNEELAKIERQFIEMALNKTKGSKTKAAELLHVTFDSLRYRIEKLRIENSGWD